MYSIPKYALGATEEAHFTGVLQYIAVAFSPHTEDARKKQKQSRVCVSVRLQSGQFHGRSLRSLSAAFPNTENKP